MTSSRAGNNANLLFGADTTGVMVLCARMPSRMSCDTAWPIEICSRCARAQTNKHRFQEPGWYALLKFSINASKQHHIILFPARFPPPTASAHPRNGRSWWSIDSLQAVAMTETTRQTSLGALYRLVCTVRQIPDLARVSLDIINA